MSTGATGSASQVTFRSNNEIAVHVSDLARAEAFYGGVLGFQLVRKTDDELEFDTGALRLYVNRDATKRSFIPSLDVADSEAAKRHVRAAGCRIVHEWSGGFYFEDAFGLVVDVVQRPRKDSGRGWQEGKAV